MGINTVATGNGNGLIEIWNKIKASSPKVILGLVSSANSDTYALQNLQQKTLCNYYFVSVGLGSFILFREYVQIYNLNAPLQLLNINHLILL